MEKKLKNLLRIFLDSIRDYESELNQGIYLDERESFEFVDIFLNSEDAFDYKSLTDNNISFKTLINPNFDKTYKFCSIIQLHKNMYSFGHSSIPTLLAQQTTIEMLKELYPKLDFGGVELVEIELILKK